MKKPRAYNKSQRFNFFNFIFIERIKDVFFNMSYKQSLLGDQKRGRVISAS